jgi:fructose-1,6-bisphosphatase I
MADEKDTLLPLNEIAGRCSFSAEEQQSVSRILEAVAEGARETARRLFLGPLHGLTGSSGQVNVQGEDVQTFDEIAQEVFTAAFRQSKSVSLLVSEEREAPESFPVGTEAPFFVAMDPLDGSSNLAVSGPVGSIFAIYRPVERESGEDPARAFLRSVSEVVGGIYVLYSVSTLLVVSLCGEVRHYALDPQSSRFLPLPGPVRYPDGGGILSINSGNYPRWTPDIRRYFDTVHSGSPRTARYVGSLVMDFHRNLVKGGIYLYPGDRPKDPTAASHPEGKLRLLYEAIPMAVIAHAAGGLATNGQTPILEIRAVHLHQRVPLVVGSRDLVLEFHRLSGAPEPVRAFPS